MGILQRIHVFLGHPVDPKLRLAEQEGKTNGLSLINHYKLLLASDFYMHFN